MPLMIRRGDTTSHGGRVLQGFDGYTVEGRAVAALGHMVACPRCKGIFPIVQGNSSHNAFGRPLAYEGMRTACGASLIASQSSTTHEMPSPSMVKMAESGFPYNPAGNRPREDEVQYVLKHAYTGDVLEQASFSLSKATGATEQGLADGKGLTEKKRVKETYQARLRVHGRP